jgi:DNA-binding response OmpR family regulator
MKRILVVDDQKELRDLLSKFLFLSGYEVESAEDGEGAMALVKKKQYDLVVVDFKMPKMNGLDLTKRLKLYDPSLSILIMSESAVGEAFFIEAGADAFLTKPLDLSSMKSLVEEILNRRRNPVSCS